jgi:hypothetical protein
MGLNVCCAWTLLGVELLRLRQAMSPWPSGADPEANDHRRESTAGCATATLHARQRLAEISRSVVWVSVLRHACLGTVKAHLRAA